MREARGAAAELPSGKAVPIRTISVDVPTAGIVSPERSGKMVNCAAETAVTRTCTGLAPFGTTRISPTAGT